MSQHEDFERNARHRAALLGIGAGSFILLFMLVILLSGHS